MHLTDLHPTAFRVFMGVAALVLSLLLQLHLGLGSPSAITAVNVLVSLVCGALVYWLAHALVKYTVMFTPVIAAIGLLVVVVVMILR
ncbi:MAG: hypothetical protein JWP52_3755 [Rhizobacter sp.]|nr:hypothetical protein [Rhizobacter sp.]